MNDPIEPLPPSKLTRRSRLTRIFISLDESRLRLVWRFLVLFVLILVLTVPLQIMALLASALKLFPPNLSPLFVFILPSGLSTLVAVLITRRFIDRRSITSMGLKLDHRAIYDLLIGVGIGGLLMASIFVAELTSGWLKFKWATFFTPSSLLEFLIWGIGFTTVGFYEEMLFRGYLFQNIEDGLTTFWAILISCVFFSLAHLSNPNYHWGSVLGLLLSSLFLTFAYLRTRQLWLPIGLHIGWNFFQGPVFGFPVSGLQTFTIIHQQVNGPALITGGDFGPEGGLVLLIGLVLGTLLIYCSRKPGKEPLAHE
jgi:membrane protease YdiL (CAAX protease family)